MPRLLGRIVKYWSPPCFVALVLLMMALAFFGGTVLSEPLPAAQGVPALAPTVPPPEVVAQTWGNLGLCGAQVAEMDASRSRPMPAILRRQEFFLSRRG